MVLRSMDAAVRPTIIRPYHEMRPTYLRVRNLAENKGLLSIKSHLHTLVAGDKSKPFIEAMGILAGFIRGELYQSRAK